MKTYADAYKAVRKLIEKPENFCQNDYSQDEKGNYCPVDDKRACKFCIDGAMFKIQMDTQGKVKEDDLYVGLKPFCLEMGHAGAILINDDEGHAKTLELLDKAIAYYEQNPTNLPE